MSRNLCRTDCYFCQHPVRTTEPPRPITAEDCRRHFGEYEGMTVANAECPACGAEYLAWVDERARYGHRARQVDPDVGFIDLSFRRSFNDEPADADCPKWRVRIETRYVRTEANPPGEWTHADEPAVTIEWAEPAPI